MNFDVKEHEVKPVIKEETARLPERMDQAIEADETQRMLDFYQKFDTENPEHVQTVVDRCVLQKREDGGLHDVLTDKAYKDAADYIKERRCDCLVNFNAILASAAERGISFGDLCKDDPSCCVSWLQDNFIGEYLCSKYSINPVDIAVLQKMVADEQR